MPGARLGFSGDVPQGSGLSSSAALETALCLALLELAGADEPDRVAEAIDRMALDHAVLTMVARDDLDDGGMAHVASCVDAIRSRRPTTRIETLISDVRGDADFRFQLAENVLRKFYFDASGIETYRRTTETGRAAHAAAPRGNGEVG